jgi:hypothetical protein
MQVCKELGMTVAQGLEMSVLELKLWAAFFKIETERTEKAIQRSRAKR